MKAEILSIGSEITTGQNLDTNCQWLSRRLAEIGIPVGFHTTVADDLADNVAAFRIACDRADLVIATGGLGPTLDDLTREVIATVAGVPLEEHAASLEHIKEMFARRGRVMPDRNRVQALLPEGRGGDLQRRRHRAGHLDEGRQGDRRRDARRAERDVPHVRGAGAAATADDGRRRRGVHPAEDQHVRLGRVGGRGRRSRT